jgi:very-short-patch-repair endonuclease
MPYVSRRDRDQARDLRRHQTGAERALWRILRHPDLTIWHRRDAFLSRKGWRILRFWNEEILTNPDYVLAEIKLALGPHPTSPTSWGRSSIAHSDNGDPA